MTEHDDSLASRQHGAEDLVLPEEPTPQDYGFPEKPNVAQVRCWTNQQLWLEAFKQSGSVGEACETAGIPVPTAEAWADRDMYGFKTRKAAAAQAFMGKVEAEINRRAIEGIDHPVIYKGEITATYREYSDNLLMFRAKRLDPEYRDSYNPPPSQSPPITKIIINLAPGVTWPDGSPPPGEVEGEHWDIPEGQES